MIEVTPKSKIITGIKSVLANIERFLITFWLSIFIYKDKTVPRINVADQREAIIKDFLFNSKSINVLIIPTVNPSRNVDKFILFLLTNKLLLFFSFCKLFYL